MAQVQVQPQAAAAAPNGGAYTIATDGGPFVCTLYVSDLDLTVNDFQLSDLFNQIGQVHWVRICRELTTRTSLGYGYVNYLSPHDAVRALDVLNFTPLNGKTIRIMCSHYDPSFRKSESKNIFIKNLDKSIDHKALYDIFSTFGKILSCEIATDDNGQSKGYGFVKFDNERSAHKAIEKVNGMLFNDKQVYVGQLIQKQEREIVLNQSKFKDIYVKNLSESTTDEDIRNVFGKYGPITSALVMRDADGKSKCLGFVKFENEDDAARAVEALNGKKFDEEWYVAKVQNKSEREEEVSNLEKATAAAGARQRIIQVKKKTDDKDGEKDMQMQYKDEERKMMQKQEQRATNLKGMQQITRF